jgi:hypothetical protein
MERRSGHRGRLRKLLIPTSRFANLRWDLDRFGVNAHSMFPDIDGLCRYLGWLHSLSDDE